MVLRQLQLQGYLDWEVIQAGCNVVVRYRVDQEGVASAHELVARMERYIRDYRETEESPFPPAESFTKRRLREQILMDRAARMTRFAAPSPGATFSTTELEHTAPEPHNLAYSKSDGIHGWRILFYDLITEIPVENVYVEVISGDNEASFEAAESLARDLASDAGLIWDWLSGAGIRNNEKVVISVYIEPEFSKKFAKAHAMLVKDGQLTNRLPIAVGAARKRNGTLGVAIVLKEDLPERDSEKTRKMVLQFALCGVFHLLSAIGKAEALDMSGKLVQTL